MLLPVSSQFSTTRLRPLGFTTFGLALSRSRNRQPTKSARYETSLFRRFCNDTYLLRLNRVGSNPDVYEKSSPRRDSKMGSELPSPATKGGPSAGQRDSDQNCGGHTVSLIWRRRRYRGATLQGKRGGLCLVDIWNVKGKRTELTF